MHEDGIQIGGSTKVNVLCDSSILPLFVWISYLMRAHQSEPQTGIVRLHSERYEMGSTVDGGQKNEKFFFYQTKKFASPLVHVGPE